MNKTAFIEQSDYFRGVSDTFRERLADLCVPQNLDNKAILFNEGDIGHAFYLLVNGAVGLYKGVESGKEVVIKIVKPGEPFAEVILFEQNTYPVTAIAIRSSLVFMIPKSQFSLLLCDELMRNDFISMLMRKQRYLAERIKFLTMHDVEDRFFMFLAEHYGNSEKVRLNISKKDIAAAIGTTPETYSRLITRLTNEGRIEVADKTIIIKSMS
ncbi:MAG: Crp/Fnr family transcriptional regulator [Fibrobacter sp.]|nr:Crp/Fnr family transcriptional regulator [Fibrobacter sp.]